MTIPLTAETWIHSRAWLGNSPKAGEIGLSRGAN